MKLIFLMIALLIPLVAVSLSQQQIQSASDDCRIITTADLTDPRAPIFEAYPAKRPHIVSKPKLNTSSNPIAKRYRTVLRRDIAKGPNYAGHYRVVVWGCGSSCAIFAVVNLTTGRVITPQGFSVVSGVHLGADEFLPNTESDDWGFRFRSNSKLLVVLGALDEDDAREGAYYFSLEGERLRPIHSTVIKKNCDHTSH